MRAEGVTADRLCISSSSAVFFAREPAAAYLLPRVALSPVNTADMYSFKQILCATHRIANGTPPFLLAEWPAFIHRVH